MVLLYFNEVAHISIAVRLLGLNCGIILRKAQGKNKLQGDF